MTPGQQIALMKVIETREACQNQDPTPKDLKVRGVHLPHVALLIHNYYTVFEIAKIYLLVEMLL